MVTEEQAEAIVHERLGDTVGAVKLGGYWVIGISTDSGWDRLSPEPLRRSLELAIKDVERTQHGHDD